MLLCKFFALLLKFLFIFPFITLKRIYTFLFSKNKDYYLQGNFAPVKDEITKAKVVVSKGTLPNDLNGYYLRNGPNNQFKQPGFYHW